MVKKMRVEPRELATKEIVCSNPPVEFENVMELGVKTMLVPENPTVNWDGGMLSRINLMLTDFPKGKFAGSKEYRRLTFRMVAEIPMYDAAGGVNQSAWFPLNT
jgi:hypothetical protein